MQFFYNLRIATKLLISFAAVLSLTCALGVFSILQLGQVNHTSVDLSTNWMPSIRVLLEMKFDTARYRSLEAQHILAGSDADRAKYDKKMTDILAQFDKNSALYVTLISEPEERVVYSEFQALWKRYMVEHEKIIQLSRESKDKEAAALQRAASSTISGEIANRIDRLVQVNVDGGQASSASGNALYASSRLWIIGLLCTAMLLGVLLALSIARLISRPLNAALKVAQTVAAGDLTSNIVVASTDETGQLLHALHQMNGNLQDIVGRVRGGAETIATASSQIAAGNLDLSSRTEQQASSLEETASSMEELTSTVKQNSDNARQANGLARTASEVARKGSSVVAEVVGTMNAINDSSRKIVDIIAVIDGIAFQTNILALNAAVEAARAGEQGRGFAVVASEVRSLAQRSAAAAKEIKTLIGDSVEKVEVGAKLVNQAGATMDEIVESVKRVTDIMEEITAASQEQTAGIEQINQAIAQMDEVTQQNAALVEQAAAAAASLEDQAGSLSQVVSVFNLGVEVRTVGNHLPVAKAISLGKRPASAQRANGNAAIPALRGAGPLQTRPRSDVIATGGGEWEQF